MASEKGHFRYSLFYFQCHFIGTSSTTCVFVDFRQTNRGAVDICKHVISSRRIPNPLLSSDLLTDCFCFHFFLIHDRNVICYVIYLVSCYTCIVHMFTGILITGLGETFGNFLVEKDCIYLLLQFTDKGVHRRVYEGLQSLRQPGALASLEVGSRKFLFTGDEGSERSYTDAIHGFTWSDASTARSLGKSHI